MATVTKGRTFVSGETVTPAKLNELVDNATVTGIVDADVSASAAIALSKLATGALPTAITVASANIVDGTIVAGDIASGAVTAPKLQNGVTLQTVYAQTATGQYIDTVIPSDNTKPQNTEGEEVVTASITPSSNTSKVLVEALINGTQENGGGGTLIVALFKDSDASAIATTHRTFTAGWGGQLALMFQDSPATTASVTYKVRAGYASGGGGFFINQYPTGAAFDGTMISCLKLTEIKA